MIILRTLALSIEFWLFNENSGPWCPLQWRLSNATKVLLLKWKKQRATKPIGRVVISKDQNSLGVAFVEL